MKKVFTVETTYHMNAAPHQAHEINNWLVRILTEIARESSEYTTTKIGKTVTVIVEVLDG